MDQKEKGIDQGKTKPNEENDLIKLDQLHDYGLAAIFEYLSFNERLRLRSVNKRMYEFSKTALAWDSNHVKLPFDLTDDSAMHKFAVAKQVSSVNMCATLNKLHQVNMLRQRYSHCLTDIKLTVPNVEMISTVLHLPMLKSLELDFPIIELDDNWASLPLDLPPLKYVKTYGYIPNTFATFLEKFHKTLKQVIFYPLQTGHDSCHYRCVQLLPNVTWFMIFIGQHLPQSVLSAFHDLVHAFPQSNIFYINMPESAENNVFAGLQL